MWKNSYLYNIAKSVVDCKKKNKEEYVSHCYGELTSLDVCVVEIYSGYE